MQHRPTLVGLTQGVEPRFLLAVHGIVQQQQRCVKKNLLGLGHGEMLPQLNALFLIAACAYLVRSEGIFRLNFNGNPTPAYIFTTV